MKRFLGCLLGVVLAVTAIVGTVYAADAGSADDPLVSKSYVDDKIEQVMDKINSSSNNNTSSAAALTTFTPVNVAAGKTILGGEGTEIILRSGSAKVVLNGSDTITDATTGKSLAEGTTLSANHLTIIPRDDGRGYKVTKDAWFIVKGSYTIS
jgi:putative cell wall-binding protein